MDTIIKPRIWSLYSKFQYISPIIFGGAFLYLIYLSRADIFEMFIPILFFVAFIIIGYSQSRQIVSLSDDAIRVSMPFNPEVVISFHEISSLTCVHIWKIFIRLRYNAFVYVTKKGERIEVPMYVWDKDELNDILDTIFARHPELQVESI